MRKALVTGGCGFIGSNLAKHLVGDGWSVTPLFVIGYLPTIAHVGIERVCVWSRIPIPL